MDILKSAENDTRFIVTQMSLRDMCIKYGPDMFEPHLAYLKERKEKEQQGTIHQGFVQLIDQIEGRR